MGKRVCWAILGAPAMVVEWPFFSLQMQFRRRPAPGRDRRLDRFSSAAFGRRERGAVSPPFPYRAGPHTAKSEPGPRVYAGLHHRKVSGVFRRSSAALLSLAPGAAAMAEASGGPLCVPTSSVPVGECWAKRKQLDQHACLPSKALACNSPPTGPQESRWPLELRTAWSTTP